jgi:prephenate dehydrogenase
MGGSLAAALSTAGVPVLLHHRRSEVAAEAQARGWGRAVADPVAAVADAALAVVCTPVATIVPLVRQLAAAAGAAVITDVGSTKGGICSDLQDLAFTGRFVGSHPMCGSHHQGLAHADAELYRGALTIVTPLPTTPASATQRVAALWQRVGCRLLTLSPDDHDRAVAGGSHLPHILASLTASLADDAALAVAASGFRDTTRIAAADPTLWRDILLANAAAITPGLAQARARLTVLEAALAAGDGDAISAWLAMGTAVRRRYDACSH